MIRITFQLPDNTHATVYGSAIPRVGDNVVLKTRKYKVNAATFDYDSERIYVQLY